MATLEKLVRTVEALKLHQTPSVSLDETMTKKDKIAHCLSVTDVLCNQSIKNSAESAKYLSMAMDMYFTLLDDSDSDIRMVADENLNKVIRTQGESNFSKILVELFKEVKKNGGSRSVRAALWRFAYLAPYIKPAKCRPYLVNMLPCLELIIKRTEESIHETLAFSLPLLFKVFGKFTNDHEIKSLMKAFLGNLGSSSAVLRRTAAANLVVLVTNSRKPAIFGSWLLNTASDLLLPLGSDILNYLIMGSLTVCRLVLPHLKGDEEPGNFVKLYEICIHFVNHQDHNIINTSLETLQCLLKVESSLFIYLINSPGGLMSSSVTEIPSESRDVREFERTETGLPTDPSVQSLSDIAASKPVLTITQSVDTDEPPPLEKVSPTQTPEKLNATDSLDGNISDDEFFDIGKVTGPGISLHYLARLLVSKFLLTQEKGGTVPNIRISVATLAISCLSEIMLHTPQVWNLPLSVTDSELSITTVMMNDLTLYLEHEDPGIKGSLSKLLAIVLRGACVESGGQVSHWFQGNENNEVVLVDMLISTLQDSSSLTAKQALSGIKYLVPKMLESDCCVETSHLLQALLQLTDNNYWLIKVEVSELLASLDPLSTSYIYKGWSSELLTALTPLLGDEDQRVRSGVAKCFASLASTLFMDQQNLAFEKCKLIYQSTNSQTSPEEFCQSYSETLPKPDVSDKAASIYQTVIKIYNLLKTAARKELLFGCIETLHQLTIIYPPTQFPGAWGIHIPRVKKFGVGQETVNQASAVSILGTVLNLLQSCLPCLDLSIHSTLLSLAGNLFTGLVCYNLRETSDVPKESVNNLVYADLHLSRLGENLILHSVKLLSICQHVIEDILPAQASSKPSIPSLQTTNLSPIKKKAPDTIPPLSPIPSLDRQASKEEKRGQFFGNPFYMRLYDSFKSSYGVYKTSLDEKSEERIKTFVSKVLNCLSEILSFVIGHDISKFVEEYLIYMKACMPITPRSVLVCVQSALKCLFKINSPFVSLTCFPSFPRIQTSPSIFEVIISSPYTSFTLEHGLNLEAKDFGSTLNSSITRFPMVRNNPFKVGRSITDKASLSSFIRLFEPVVIKALKHYTVTCQVNTQVEVLSLLIQLIRLRVNYCLLDSEQIFIGFVLKQLESIEENQIKDAELLIPAIFEFLCLLSYENYHSKTIIDVPKILQLCESLSTAEQSWSVYAVAALKVVARDLFSSRTATPDNNELETQREVIMSMLLKHINHSIVINSIANILNWLKLEPENEEKARKLSRQILDVLLPKLCNHKVELSEAEHVQALIKLLKALSPGALRPCDAMITSLLGTAVDLACLKEVHSWLAFTLASMVIIFQLSPEEAVLGRLQDLGIMLGSGGSSILDSSIDSSVSSCSDPQRGGSGADNTLVTFIFHCLGSAVSKLNQIVFTSSYHNTQGEAFLVWEIKELLLFIMYIMQSGNCPKIAKAACYLAKNTTPGAMHNIDMITDTILQLRTTYPTLVTKWLYIMMLFERNLIAIWAQALNTNRSVSPARLGSTELSEPAVALNLEIVRRSSLALVSNYLIENNHDGELLAWFLSTQIREIVLYHDEPQINELLNVIHRQPASSRLLVQSISVRWELLKTSGFIKHVLDSLVNTHKLCTGHLVMLLVTKFLTHPILAIAKEANKEACKRIESLLQETEKHIHEQIPSTDVAQIMQILSKKKYLIRFPRLLSLLNQLTVSFYELSPIDFGEGRKFHPGGISSVDLDNTWFLHQVKKYCCDISAAPKECAKLLSNLGFGDIMLVLTAKDFNLKILEECLSQGILLPDGRAPSIDSLDRLPGLLSDPDRSPGLRDVCQPMKEGPPLYRCGSQVLLQHIRNLVELLPRPPQVYCCQNYWDPSPQEAKYTHKLNEFFSRSESRNLAVTLFPAYSRLLLTYPQLPGRRPTLPPHSLLEMARFGLLALELVKWLNYARHEEVRGKERIVDNCLQAAGLTLLNPHLSSALSLASHNALVSSAAIAITDHVQALLPGLKLPVLSYENLNSKLLEKNPTPTLVAGACLAKLLIAFENKVLRSKLAENVLSTVIGLSRLQQFSSLCRAPPIAFKLGWNPEVILESQVLELPSVPVDLLQEKDVLFELIWRLNILGWSSRPQYEETWMSLLSVLNVSHDDLTNEEISAVSQSTAVVVNALSSLLVATLGLPVAGVPGAQLLHHPRDTPHTFLLSGRGQQLTAIQNIIHQRLDSSDIRIGLPVDSSVNLERSFPHLAVDCKTSYTPLPRTKYGPGQVSLNYISTSLAYHEEGGSDDRQSLASSALPLYLLIREENLAAAGLDTNSCIHFIIDLFSQWLAFGGQDTPLCVLSSAVHSILMVSDIFTQSNQFSWMLSTFSELQKVHPIEDEVMTAILCQGICKAMSVLGPPAQDSDLIDRIKKSLETNLKSPHVFARSSALHGALYLLQTSDSLGVDLQTILSIVVEHIKQNLLVGGGRVDTEQSVDSYTLLLWSSLFYVLENFSSSEIAEPELETNLQQLSFATISSPDLPKPLYTCILAGLERLVVAGKIKGRHLDQLVKISTDLMTEWAPVSVIPAVQLFLASMYASHPPALAEQCQLSPAPITDPELLMQMMEQMSILFDCVRRAAPQQAEILSEILPQVLIDFFPASDVVNRVISEFISPGQPHPALLAGVLSQIFRAAVDQDQQGMITEWVLMSLPNFTRRSPITHSIWCLTCFFIAASANPCLQAIFPHLLYRGTRNSLQESVITCEDRRPASLNHDERRLFCLAAVDFYSFLTDVKLKQKFRETFESVCEPGNPYADLLAAIQHKDEKET